jgi:hypothetical protein
MKKLFYLLVVIILILSSICMVGCTSNNVIDNIDRIDCITITNRSTDEVIEITDESQIETLGNYLSASLSIKSFQERWNSMLNTTTYTYNYTINISVEKTLFKNAYSYDIIVGRDPEGDQPSDSDKTYVCRDSKYGNITLDGFEYINGLFE